MGKERILWVGAYPEFIMKNDEWRFKPSASKHTPENLRIVFEEYLAKIGPDNNVWKQRTHGAPFRMMRKSLLVDTERKNTNQTVMEQDLSIGPTLFMNRSEFINAYVTIPGRAASGLASSTAGKIIGLPCAWYTASGRWSKPQYEYRAREAILNRDYDFI